jgi:hypothetical protein
MRPAPIAAGPKASPARSMRIKLVPQQRQMNKKER